MNILFVTLKFNQNMASEHIEEINNIGFNNNFNLCDCTDNTETFKLSRYETLKCQLYDNYDLTKFKDNFNNFCFNNNISSEFKFEYINYD